MNTETKPIEVIENIVCDECGRLTVTDETGEQVCHNCGLTYQTDE